MDWAVEQQQILMSEWPGGWPAGHAATGGALPTRAVRRASGTHPGRVLAQARAGPTELPASACVRRAILCMIERIMPAGGILSRTALFSHLP